VIIAIGDIYVQVARRGEVRELMLSTQERVREEPGCLSYRFAETLEEPAHFLVVQQWRDQEALDEHYRSRAFADYQAGIATALARNSELRLHVVHESFLAVDSSVLDISQDD
jgi:quinol monooxygenase YgiN